MPAGTETPVSVIGAPLFDGLSWIVVGVEDADDVDTAVDEAADHGARATAVVDHPVAVLEAVAVDRDQSCR